MSWTVLLSMTGALIVGVALGMSLGALGRFTSDEEIMRLRMLLAEHGIPIPWEHTD